MNVFKVIAAAALVGLPRAAPSPSHLASRSTAFTAHAEPSVRRAGALRTPRSAQAATPIAGNRVLVTGGMPDGGGGTRSFELYDANADRIVAVGDMAESRASHTATLLPDGRVLVAGGYNGAYLATAEIFDPGTGRFSATGSMNEGRSGHTATLLGDGTVLVTGGNGDGWSFLASAEVYDPVTGRFSRAVAWSPIRD